MDWLITAWGVWKKEHLSGEVAVDEKLALTRLGPQVMEAAFKQAPVSMKMRMEPVCAKADEIGSCRHS